MRYATIPTKTDAARRAGYVLAMKADTMGDQDDQVVTDKIAELQAVGAEAQAVRDGWEAGWSLKLAALLHRVAARQDGAPATSGSETGSRIFLTRKRRKFLTCEE